MPFSTVCVVLLVVLLQKLALIVNVTNIRGLKSAVHFCTFIFFY